MTGAPITSKQLHILQHSLGVDQHGRGRRYRQHFVTGKGSVDYADCVALIDAGFMVRGRASPLSGGDDVFLVSPAGQRAVTIHSPPPPKLSASKARYQRYLNFDSGLSFGEWLKSGLSKGSPAW